MRINGGGVEEGVWCGDDLEGLNACCIVIAELKLELREITIFSLDFPVLGSLADN